MAGKAGIILSLLGKLDDAAEKTVGKKVSKAKIEKIDAERVQEALDQKLIENPQYLEELSDKEYKALMRALPAKSQADMMGDDYAMEMYEQQAEAAGGMTPKEAAENLSLFQDTEDMYGYLQKLKPQQLKEFKENVSEEDINLYGPALDLLETLTPRAIKMAGGKMKNDPFKVKYNEGGAISKKDIEHINSFKNKKDRESLIGKYQIFAGYDAVEKAGIDELKEPKKAEKLKKEAAEKILKDLKRHGLNMGGMPKYNEGSMLVPPEREEYSNGGIAASDHIANDWRMVDSKQLDAEEALDRSLSQLRKAKNNKELSDLQQQIEGAWYKATGNERLDGVALEIYSVDFENPKSMKALDKRIEQRTKDRYEKNMGGMMKYNEGSMLVAPEMGLEDEMPEDTYDNIPEDEKEAVEASQLPDDEMEQEHLKYVLNEALPIEDQEYLMDILDTDERLNDIFDKVISTATEFSGAGEVNGPGTGTSDSIPARLSDGEFVFTKKATDQLGADKLQTMMDEAERAYDGGLMKKAFGGMVNDMPVDQKKGMYDPALEDEEIKKQMIDANQMPSVRNR